jgi:hypothetical protein
MQYCMPTAVKQLANFSARLAGRLPGKAGGQVCRASLPGKAAGQVCRARLPGKAAGKAAKRCQSCQIHQNCVLSVVMIGLYEALKQGPHWGYRAQNGVISGL